MPARYSYSVSLQEALSWEIKGTLIDALSDAAEANAPKWVRDGEGHYETSVRVSSRYIMKTIRSYTLELKYVPAEGDEVPLSPSEALSSARDKKWSGRLSELTEYEKGLLSGFDDGYAAGMDELEYHDIEPDDTEEYRQGYSEGFQMGNLAA